MRAKCSGGTGFDPDSEEMTTFSSSTISLAFVQLYTWAENNLIGVGIAHEI